MWELNKRAEVIQLIGQVERTRVSVLDHCSVSPASSFKGGLLHLDPCRHSVI